MGLLSGLLVFGSKRVDCRGLSTHKLFTELIFLELFRHNLFHFESVYLFCECITVLLTKFHYAL